MTSSPVPPRSPSVQAHRRQFFWQILLPVLLAALLILAAMVWTATGATGQNRLWADVSVIWLILPVMTFGLVLLVFLVAMIWLLARIIRGTPRVTEQAQQFSRNVRDLAERIADGFARPILVVEGLRASWKRIIGKD